MALNICALLLVLAIVFMNSIFGLFGGLINMFCAIMAAVVSLGYFEVLNEFATKQGLHPSYSEPVCLVALFIVTLLILRLAADKLIRGNVRVPMYADWAGGAVTGFVIAQICIGILLMGVMMLPLGGEVLQFQRFERDPEDRLDERQYVEFYDNRIWLRSDEFTAGLVSLLSSGSLRGKTTLASVYPSFPEWVSWTSNTVQPESLTAPRREQGDGFEKGLRVTKWWETTVGVEGRYRKTLPTRDRKDPEYSRKTYTPDTGMKLVGVRLELDQSSADRVGRGSAYHRFRPTMIRIVGTANGKAQHYPARILGGADPKIRNALRIADMDNDFAISAGGSTPLDVYFEVDEDFDASTAFVEYRRHARAALPREPEDAPSDQLAASGGRQADADGGSGRFSGGTGFVAAIIKPSGDHMDLPFEMSAARIRGSGGEVSGEEFVSGRVFSSRERLEASGSEAKIVRFKLPSGYRLCQVRYRPHQARSLVGDVFNYAAQLNQYFAEDTQGDRYLLAGYYALVPRGNREYLELFFTGSAEDPTFRGMLDFKQIKPNELQQEEAQLALLFVVPPGKTIRGIVNQTGKGVTGIRLRMRSTP